MGVVVCKLCASSAHSAYCRGLLVGWTASGQRPLSWCERVGMVVSACDMSKSQQAAAQAACR